MDLSVLTKNFGPWHRRIFIAIFYMNVTGVFQNFGIVFLTSYPKYHCIGPFVGLNDTCQVSNGTSLVPCTKWKYQGPHSIISEWDLVCDKAWLVSLSKSVYMVGFLFSVTIFGQLADLFGRFPTMCIGYVIAAASTSLILLSSSYTMFLVLRFFQSFGRMGLQIISYNLMLELTGVNHRTVVGVVSQISWSLGGCILAGIAWFVRDWFWLQLVFSISFLPFVLAYGIMPESPRWLLIKGKHEQLIKTLRKVADTNNVKLDVDLSGSLKDATKIEREKETKSNETVWNVYKSPQLRKRILILQYLWPVVLFMYYGLLLNTNDVAGNPYLNFVLSSLIEMVSIVANFYGSRIFGRRLLMAFLLLGASATSLVLVAVPKDNVWLQVCLFMGGRFFTKGALVLLYLFTSELFPTVVRNVAFGSCSAAGRIGAVLAPFVTEIGKASYDWVPSVLYGCLFLVGALLELLLPETKDRDITDTLQQNEEME